LISIQNRKLSISPRAADDGDDVLYLAANHPFFNSDAVTHFSIGIFWKASVHSWKRNRAEPMIELGLYER
jgi:hypothetical protein